MRVGLDGPEGPRPCDPTRGRPSWCGTSCCVPGIVTGEEEENAPSNSTRPRNG
ncbi:hypothetical protein [Streptomyces sp. H27-D2]|uniref:hypothetical protein n=1 Tax=Streptomyces sp. H27-D2 TaxID=3046304 RepID=UPI002DB9117D|nr:hypothetical protein [Streptomyces sp. H27-D2]MEC4019757.1 hypothetical protein [Streptomyces sp. H27-D2]